MTMTTENLEAIFICTQRGNDVRHHILKFVCAYFRICIESKACSVLLSHLSIASRVFHLSVLKPAGPNRDQKEFSSL